jgi:hypothetical protein
MFRPCKRAVRLYFKPVADIQWECGGGRDLILQNTCGGQVFVFLLYKGVTNHNPNCCSRRFRRVLCIDGTLYLSIHILSCTDTKLIKTIF